MSARITSTIKSATGTLAGSSTPTFSISLGALAGQQSSPYSASIAVTGGVSPFTFTFTGVTTYSGSTAYTVGQQVTSSGIVYMCILAGTGHTPASSPTYWQPSLPPGITMSSAGALSGTPTTTGTFTSNITCTDSTTGTPLVCTATFSIFIATAGTTVPGAPTLGSTDAATTLTSVCPGNAVQAAIYGTINPTVTRTYLGYVGVQVAPANSSGVAQGPWQEITRVPIPASGSVAFGSATAPYTIGTYLNGQWVNGAYQTATQPKLLVQYVSYNPQGTPTVTTTPDSSSPFAVSSESISALSVSEGTTYADASQSVHMHVSVTPTFAVYPEVGTVFMDYGDGNGWQWNGWQTFASATPWVFDKYAPLTATSGTGQPSTTWKVCMAPGALNSNVLTGSGTPPTGFSSVTTFNPTIPAAPTGSGSAITVTNMAGQTPATLGTSFAASLYMGTNGDGAQWWQVNLKLTTAGSADASCMYYAVWTEWCNSSGVAISPGGVSNVQGWLENEQWANNGSTYVWPLAMNYPQVDGYMKVSVWAISRAAVFSATYPANPTGYAGLTTTCTAVGSILFEVGATPGAMGNSANMLAAPNFGYTIGSSNILTPTLSGWLTSGTGTISAVSSGGTSYCQLSLASQSANVSQSFNVRAGDSYLFEMWAALSTGTFSGTLQLQLNWYNTAGVQVGAGTPAPISMAGITTTLQAFDIQGVVPAGAVMMVPTIYATAATGTVWLTNGYLAPAQGSGLARTGNSYAVSTDPSLNINSSGQVGMSTSDLSNMVLNGLFGIGSGLTGWTYANAVPQNVGGVSGSWRAVLSPGAGAYIQETLPHAVTPGNQYYVSCWVAADAGSSSGGTFEILMCQFNSAGTLLSSPLVAGPQAYAPAAAAWVQVQGVYTVPAGVSAIAVQPRAVTNTTANWYVDNVVLKLVTPTDGATTTTNSIGQMMAADYGGVSNGGFEQGSLTWILDNAATGTWQVTSAANHTPAGTYCLGYIGASPSSSFPTAYQNVTVTPGQQLSLNVWTSNTAGATGTGQLQIRYLDNTDTYCGGIVSVSFNATTGPTTWQKVTLVGGAAPTAATSTTGLPACSAWIMLILNGPTTGNWYFDDVTTQALATGGPNYVDVNGVLQTALDGTTLALNGSNQITLNSVPVTALVNSVFTIPSNWTYAGSLVVSQLVAGTTLNLGTSVFASSSTGPAVKLGSAGAVFVDNYTTPANTMTCSSSGINITGVGGITIQYSTTGLKLVLNSSAIQFQYNTSTLMQLTGTSLTYYYPGSTNQSLAISSAGTMTFYTPSGTAVVAIGTSGLSIGSGATITSPSISGGSISGTSLSIATSGSYGTVAINSVSQGINVNSGLFNMYVTAVNVTSIYGTQLANFSYSQISIANGSGAGCYMNPGGYFEVAIGGTSYNGGTFTFQDLAGTTHTVKGGILIS